MQRTLLAWVRTAIALIALGLVLAKFAIVLHSLDPGLRLHATHRLSLGLVLSGGTVDLFAGIGYARHPRSVGGRLLPLLLVGLVAVAAGYAAVFVVPR